MADAVSVSQTLISSALNELSAARGTLAFFFDKLFDGFVKQPDAYIVGGLLVIAYQASQFQKIGSEPQELKKISNFESLHLREFCPMPIYILGMTGFLLISLLLYVFFCGISPEVVKGAVKMLYGAEATKKVDALQLPYPLYVVAIYLGLTQPVIPGFPKWGLALRDLIHDQMHIPDRLLDFCEKLSRKLLAKCKNDKSRLSTEIRRLTSDEFRSKMESFSDTARLETLLQTTELKSHENAEEYIKDASVRELRAAIETLVSFFATSCLRHSGWAGLRQLQEIVAPGTKLPAKRNVLLPRLALFSFFFLVLLLLVAIIIDSSAPHFDKLINQYQNKPLWPTRIWPEYFSIVPSIYAGIIAAVITACGRQFNDRANLSAIDVLYEKFWLTTAVFAMSLIAIVLATLYDYGTLPLKDNQRPEISIFLAISAINTFMSVYIFLFICSWLVSSRRTIKKSALLVAVIKIGVIEFAAAMAYDFSFLNFEYFAVPDYAAYKPGVDHMFFTGLVYMLIACGSIVLCAFIFKLTQNVSAKTKDDNLPNSGEADLLAPSS